ncbi:hypothetical protein OPV22_009530 [Ensete ventricosum]|uniref:Plastid lipid-associated protein/fibrillin conserved domain-containing protein n=1 Tax=Ensete ventricosum TaxID=4639 RepID=A0AAV8RG46_ENSVE|nr:hypothetical protein OPV22_009530 [Ensete ventricosum]
MKPALLQTPRRTPSPASHGARAKETPPPSKHHPKVLPRALIPSSLPDLLCLSSDFSAVPEDAPLESHDLIESSPEASSTVEDPAEGTPVPPSPLPVAPEHGLQESIEIDVKKPTEEEVAVVDRLREALLEVRKSTDVSSGSKKLLAALVELAMGDMGGDPREENGRWDSAFWAKVRIGILGFLILLVALMDLLAISTVPIGGEGRDFSGLPPPT